MRSVTAVFVAALSILAVSVAAEKPKVGFFSEGLCPYCRRYLSRVLLPLYNTGLLQNADVKMYASGNARMKVNETTGETYLKCQHGEPECDLNRMIGCTIEYSTGLDWVPAVACIETLGKAILKVPPALAICVNSTEIFQQVEECYKGDEGQQLFEAAFNATRSLKVQHKWVPWVVVDDVPLYDAAFALPTAICLNIPKEERPEICYSNPYGKGADSNGALGAESNGAFDPSFSIPRELGMDSKEIT
ncbi:hypothetical protein BSKO_04078 [Bryopsis sp. KO-2023]|nr:hypothetical protein BSKO_04078 [Bryopsis sp. KO-2023]